MKILETPSHYVHGRDNRTKETILNDKATIQNLCELNEFQFKSLVEQESKREVIKFKNQILQMELSGGRYFSYTDRTNYINEQDKNNINIPTIMTIHGIPGSQNDFLNMQSNVQARLSCRWINFLMPGLDRKDERRGTYNGYLEDTALLINDFLNQLKIDKIILITHSAGGMYSKNFVHSYPEKIKALVQLASIGLEMWRPILYQNKLFETIGIDITKTTKEQIEKEEFRKSFNENLRNYIKSLEQKSDNKSLQVWKILSNNDHLMLLKAQTSYKGGFDTLFFNMKNIDRTIPRFFAYSTADILIEQTHCQQEITHAILSPQSLQFQINNKSKFDNTFKLRDQENVLKNFIFAYHDVGHSFQHHKGFDLSIKLCVFIKMLDEIQPVKINRVENQNQIKPNL